MNDSCLATCPLRVAMKVTSADVTPAMRRRLAAFGVRPGSTVNMLARTGGGRVLAIGTSRIALDRSVLERLYALPVSA